MNMPIGFRPWVKGSLFWATFLMLYVLRKVAPLFPITLIAGVDESNFQFAPWLVFLTWYLMAAVYGQLPNVGLEILYGNLATLAVGILAATFERSFELIPFSKSIQTVTWVLVAFSVIIFTLLTFKLPWADVFTEPDWKAISSLFWRRHV